MPRYHLDTSFIIDWQRGDPRVEQLKDEILEGRHQISIDPIVETEYFAGQNITRKAELLFRSIEQLANRVELATPVCRQAAAWLGPMDENMRKSHFGDALIAAAASAQKATVLAGDRGIGRVFPVEVKTY